MSNATQTTGDFKGDNLSVNMFGAVGDGSTDNRAAFRGALSVAAGFHGGAILRVPQGIYHIDVAAGPLSIPDGTRLEGGPGSVLRLFNLGAATGSVGFLLSANNVTVSGLQIESYLSNNDNVIFQLGQSGGATTPDNVTLDGLVIDGRMDTAPNVVHGILLDGDARNFALLRSTLRNLEFGLLKTNANTSTQLGIRVSHCGFDHNYADDLAFNTPAGVIENVTVADSIFRDNQSAAYSGGFGVDFAGVSRGSVVNNDFTNYLMEGIHVEDVSSGIQIRGNRLLKCGQTDYAAINFAGKAKDWIIADNFVDMSANPTAGGAKPAIFVFGSPSTDGTDADPHNGVISGNTIYLGGTNHHGLDGSGYQLTISGNTIRADGTVTAGVYTGSTSMGIRVGSFRQSVISNNTIMGVDRGIESSEMGTGGPHLIVTQNQLRDCDRAITICANGEGLLLTQNQVHNCIFPLRAGYNVVTGVPGRKAVVALNVAIGCAHPMEIYDAIWGVAAQDRHVVAQNADDYYADAGWPRLNTEFSTRGFAYDASSGVSVIRAQMERVALNGTSGAFVMTLETPSNIAAGKTLHILRIDAVFTNAVTVVAPSAMIQYQGVLYTTILLQTLYSNVFLVWNEAHSFWNLISYFAVSLDGMALTGGSLLAANNLSDVASATTAKTNLGLANVVNALQLQAASNLSDVPNIGAARLNIQAAQRTGITAHTIVLAKLTSGGSGGTLTWNADGTITGYSDPT